MIPNRAKHCREEYANGNFAASLPFACQVHGNIIVALVAELVIANKAVNELANAGGLPGHRMQHSQGLNLACRGEFTPFGLEVCQPAGTCKRELRRALHENCIAPRTEMYASGFLFARQFPAQR